MPEDRSPIPGASTALIVLPSLVSGVGIAFVLTAILVNQQVVQDVFLVTGVILLWLDFFATAAVFRFSVRSIDRRLRLLESHIADIEDRIDAPSEPLRMPRTRRDIAKEPPASSS